MGKREEPTIYIKLFLIVVFCAALLSVIYKVIVLVSQSNFTGRTFNILLLDRDAYVVHVDSTDKKISVYKFTKSRSQLLGKSNLIRSAATGIMIDAAMIGPDSTYFNNTTSFMDKSQFLNCVFPSGEVHLNNINAYDCLKLFLVSYRISSDSRKSYNESLVSGLVIPNEISGISDPEILAESKSVEIINASDVDGLGSSVARTLRGTGYNVVQLETSSRQKSAIRAEVNNSASVGRLIRAFKLPYEKASGQSIADIILILSPESLKSK